MSGWVGGWALGCVGEWRGWHSNLLLVMLLLLQLPVEEAGVDDSVLLQEVDAGTGPTRFGPECGPEASYGRPPDLLPL